jgi:hypothetical protein
MRLLCVCASMNLGCFSPSKMHVEVQILVQIMISYPHVRCYDISFE